MKTSLKVVPSFKKFNSKELIGQSVFIKSCNCSDKTSPGLRSCVCHLKGYWVEVVAVAISTTTLNYFIKPINSKSKYAYAADRNMFYNREQVLTMIRLCVVK